MNREIFARVRWKLIVIGFICVFAVGYGLGVLFKQLGWWDGGPWEHDLLTAVHRTVSPALDLLFLWAPLVGTNYTLMPVVLVAFIVLWRKHYQLAAVQLAVVQAGSAFLNPTLKALLTRERPEMFPRRGQFGLAAYPSGHAIAVTSVVVTAAYLLYVYRGVTWPLWVAGIFSLITIYSRVYLAVHWPTDVIAGVIMGCLWFAICYYGFKDAHAAEPARPVRT